MGGGILGLSAAYACARRGARVRLVERHHIGAGSSGGVVGALAPHTPERGEPKKEFQLQSLLMAEGFWQGVEALSGVPSGYCRLGRLQPLRDAHALALAQEREIAARALWQGQADWRVVAAADHAGWAPQSATGYLVFDTLSAHIHPRRALRSLARAVRALGAEIIEGREVAPAGKTIWATGQAGLEELSQVFGRPVGNGVKGQAALLGHDARGLPQLFGEGLHIVPHADGTVAVGSTSERYFDDPTATDAGLDDVLARVRAGLPMLRDAPVLERWAGVRPRSASRAPMLGEWPGRAGHYILNGGFKIAFGMAPKLAGVMADLVLDGDGAGIAPEFTVEANM